MEVESGSERFRFPKTSFQENVLVNDAVPASTNWTLVTKGNWQLLDRIVQNFKMHCFGNWIWCDVFRRFLLFWRCLDAEMKDGVREGLPRYISLGALRLVIYPPPLFTSPSGDSCIIDQEKVVKSECDPPFIHQCQYRNHECRGNQLQTIEETRFFTTKTDKTNLLWEHRSTGTPHFIPLVWQKPLTLSAKRNLRLLRTLLKSCKSEK